MTREEAIVIALKALSRSEIPNACSDAISRRAVLELVADYDLSMGQVVKGIHALPPVTPQQRMGRWDRMSDLPNDVDDRFQCSRCGNVVHYNKVMDLRTFSRWCGRCGSYNDYKKEVQE